MNIRRLHFIILFSATALFVNEAFVAQEPFSSLVRYAVPVRYDLKIKGDSANTVLTQKALDLLKEKAPESLDFVKKYVAIIEIADQGSGMYVWEVPPRCKIGLKTIEAGTIWYSSVLVHEANHSKQYADYQKTHPGKSVPEKVYYGRAPEAECIDVQYKVLEKLGASKETLEYMKGVLDTEYWNVDYKNRWW